MIFHRFFLQLSRLGLYAALPIVLTSCVSYYKPPTGTTVPVRINALYNFGWSTLQVFADPFNCQNGQFVSASETSQIIQTSSKFSTRLEADRIHTLRYEYRQVNQLCTVSFSFRPKAGLEYEIKLEQTGRECSAGVSNTTNAKLPLPETSMYGRGASCNPMTLAQFNSNEVARRDRLSKAVDDILRGVRGGATPSVKLDDLEGLLGK
jgi:hypothetical protein